MNQPLCSFLIPTRKRVKQLSESVNSILRMAQNASNAEIVFHVDFDDSETINWVRNRSDGFINLKMVCGHREGYDSIGTMFTRCAAIATGKWVWIWNDDSVFARDTAWDVVLKEAPTWGVIAHPQIHSLGGSSYMLHEGGAFPCVPNRCWESFGVKKFTKRIDVELDELLRGENGWRTHFLPGIEVHHERGNDAELEEHRK